MSADRDIDEIVLYDVDPVNPYGRELASVLTGVVQSVSLVGSTALEWSADGVTLHRWLAAPRVVSSAVGVAGRRLTGVWRALTLLLAHRNAVLVVVWSRDFWDASWLAMAAAVTGRVIVIDHNPVPTRRHAGLKGRAERALRRGAARVVVHDSALVDAADNDAVMVAPHPPYLQWRQRFLPFEPAIDGSRIVFLGALRIDKGVNEMPGVIAELPDSVGVRVIGAGEIPVEWHRAATGRGIAIEHVGGGAVVDDADLGRSLADGGIVLAPYVGATQSGSVALAVTCGLPVLGYDVGALRSLLTDESLVAAGSASELAAVVTAWRSRPWNTARVQPEEMAAQCAQAWRIVLARLT